MRELESLDGLFDMIIVDAGRGWTPWSRRFWSSSMLNVVVTMVDDAAVLDAYGVLKASTAESLQAPVRVLVNQAPNDVVGHSAGQRIDNACRRFLARSVEALPALPRHVADRYSAGHEAPRV
jgi:MinD-like ATPase involved in chromosome partitioning or flagellar assembly